MDINTEMVNQPSPKPQEVNAKLPPMDTVLTTKQQSPLKEVKPLRSAPASQEVAQNGNCGSKVIAPLGSTSASKNRLITDFLPRINTVPALNANIAGQVTTKFDRDCHPELNDKVSPFSVANLCQEGETRPLTTNPIIPWTCQQCGVPYPTESAEDVPMPQGNIWECGPCMES